MSAALAIVAVFVLTFGTAYFVAQEFAYVSADRVELARQADAGDKRAASAIRVMERLSFMLSAAQVGITVTGLIVGLIAEPAFAQVVRPLLESVGLPESAVPGVSVAVGFAVATIIQMVLGELFPKNLALATPESLAKLLASSTHLYLAVSGPVVRLFDNSAAWLLRKVGIEPVEELHHGATLEELGHVIGESEAGGSLSSQLSGILGRALYFSEHTAGEAMVPRPDVRGVRGDDTAAAVIELVATHGHSNYPVRGEETDEVVGVVGVRELMYVAPGDVGTTLVRDIARRPLVVPDSLPLPALVEQMQDAGDEFACVVDEYGGLAGIVTLEDVSEELFGDITDETDQQAVPVTQDGDWWQLDAGLRVDEAASRTGLPLHESDDYDTVAGLIVAELGRFAEPADRLVVGAENDGRDRVEIEVVTVARHVPELVRLRRLGLVPTDGNAEAAQ
ncbi:hemolysin family protein [Jiangella endophytica]|uniref:hemolysin family protein n=1 Tax=Jiangella endophytica TaxID=1623398 RepID=UPI000E34F8DB|nr:hemolysin family protein [Jiangella endophytica]